MFKWKVVKSFAIYIGHAYAFMDRRNSRVPWVKTHGYHIVHADGIFNIEKWKRLKRYDCPGNLFRRDMTAAKLY